MGLPGRQPLRGAFVTPWPWLRHAAGWSAVVAAGNALTPLLHLGGPVTALALVAAAIAAYRLPPRELDVPLSALLRFALVDAVFLGFSAGLLLGLAMLAASLVVPVSAGAAGSIAMAWIVGAFVAQFYVLLWTAGALRRRQDSARHGVWIAGLAGAVTLVWSTGHRGRQILAHDRDVDRAVAQYERETGRSGEPLRAELSLSLHGFERRVAGLIVDSLGRPVAIGEFSLYAAHPARGLVRLTADGGLDATLPAATLDPRILAGPMDVRALDAGALLLALPDTPGPAPSPLVLRTLQPSGALDERPGVVVGISGNGYERRVLPFDVWPDGSVVVGRNGRDEGRTPCLRRFAANGAEDAEFAANVAATARELGPPDNCVVTDVRMLPDGGALVARSGSDATGAWRDGILHRLDGAGRLDAGFRPEPAAFRLAVGPRGEPFIVTLTTSAGSRPRYALAKLDASGARDTTFAPPPELFESIDAIAVAHDGALLVAGSAGGGRGLGVMRLLADGRPDPAFAAGGFTALGGFVQRMVVSAGGEIYLAGDMVDIGRGAARLPRYQIARLRADGTPDAGFDPH